MPKRRSWTCPKCRRTTYHPEDIRRSYCPWCYDLDERRPGARRPTPRPFRQARQRHTTRIRLRATVSRCSRQGPLNAARLTYLPGPGREDPGRSAHCWLDAKPANAPLGKADEDTLLALADIVTLVRTGSSRPPEGGGMPVV